MQQLEDTLNVSLCGSFLIALAGMCFAAFSMVTVEYKNFILKNYRTVTPEIFHFCSQYICTFYVNLQVENLFRFMCIYIYIHIYKSMECTFSLQ